MSLILFLLLLFLVSVIVPIVRVAAAIARARQRAREMFGRFRDNTSDAARGKNHPRQNDTKRKKINPEDGEFVKFQELPPEPPTQEQTQVTVEIEEQVEDVEWEDIK